MKPQMRQAYRFFWMITDQGVFATSNFIINILFARWLSPADYGLFTVSFSGYLFLTLVHWGIFLEPLLVLSAQIHGNHHRSYIKTLGLAHLVMIAMAVVISTVAYGIAWHYGAVNIGLAIVGAGVGGSLMLTLMTMRRLCLVFLTPRISAVVGLVYFSGVLVSGSPLSPIEVSWFTLWEIMGFWSLVCSLIIFLLLLMNTSGTEAFPIRKLLAFQSRYAPGAVVASLCQWIGFDGVYILLSSMVGLAAVAESKAVFTVANPLMQINAAMHASWLVMFSERRNEDHNIMRIVWLYVAAITASVAILGATSHTLVQIFYGGRYLAAAWQLPIYVASVGLTGLTAMLTSLFKSKGGLWQGFTPVIVEAIVAVSVALIAIPRVGQPGAVYAMFAGGAASLAATILLFRFAYPKTIASLV